MLCGHRDVDMGVVASWSVLRFLPGARLFIHEDGTLQERDVALWRRAIPGLELVAAAHGNELASKTLRDLPTLRNIRATQLYGRKLVDVHLIGNSRKVILMDSDVICFRDPAEARQCALATDRAYTWNRDTRNWYVASPGELGEITGCAVADCLNAGFAVVPRLNEREFQHLEATAVAISHLGASHCWMEQTLYAFLAAKEPGSKPLGPGYNVVVGGSDESQVLRHYVGNATIRPLFFLEGVARLESQIAILDTSRGPVAQRN